MCVMLACPFQMLIPCLLNLEDPLAFLWVEELCPRIARLFSRSRNRDIRSCFSKADRLFYAASGSNTCSLALIVGVYNMYNLFASILSSCFRTDLGTTYTSVIHCSQVISWIFEEESCLAWGQSIWTIFAVPTDNKQGLVQRMVERSGSNWLLLSASSEEHRRADTRAVVSPKGMGFSVPLCCYTKPQ